MTEYKITLSTTEPNNYVGLIKLRQGDVASQSIKATITANGKLFKFDRLAVFFNAVLPNGNVVRDKVTNVDYVNSKLNYIVADSFLQEVSTISAWFSFESGDKTIDSTKNFRYIVEAGWKSCITQGNYIYELSEIQREIEEIISNKDFSALISRIDELETDIKFLDNQKATREELSEKTKALDDVKATREELSERTKALDDVKASKQELSQAIASQDYKIANIVNGTPKGVYASLSDLNTALPSGASGIYVTRNNGHWYYWQNGTWVDGGIYQATAIQDDSLSYKKLKAAGRRGVIATSLVIDFINKKITTTNAFILDGITSFQIKSGTEFVLSRTDGYFVYNKINKNLDLVPIVSIFNSTLDENIVLGVVWAGEIVSIDNPLNTKVIHANGTIENYKNNVVQSTYSSGSLINEFKYDNVFQIDYVNNILKLRISDVNYHWYVQSDKSPVRYPVQQTEVIIGTDETPQVLYFDLSDLTLKFVGFAKYESLSDNTIFLGRIAPKLKKHYLHIKSNNGALDNLIKGHETFSYDGVIVNVYNKLRPIVDFTNKIIKFPRIGEANSLNWVIYRNNNYANIQLDDSFKDENGNVVVPLLDTAFQFLVFDLENLVIKCISNADVLAGNYNYIKLGVIMVNTKISYLNFMIDNTDLYSALDNSGSGSGSGDFEKNNIIIFGDSLSTYTGASENTSNYPAFYPKGDINSIDKTWWKPIFNKYGNHCYNAAWSGGCLTDILTDRKNGLQILDETVVAFTPDILLFVYGTNDYGQGVSSSTFNADLETFVTKARAKWPSVIVYVCSYPFNKLMYDGSAINSETVEVWNSAVQSKAKSLDCKTIDVTKIGNSQSNWNLFNIGDGVHYNAKGARLIKNNIIQQVAEFN